MRINNTKPILDIAVQSLLSGSGTSIPLFKVFMTEDAIQASNAVLRSGYIGQGPNVEIFEKALSKKLGSPNVLSLNSGTSAIHLALRLAGVEAGTEVISTPMTCTASNIPILERGARIVWADIDPMTGNIDPDDVDRKITAKTKAIIAVHWGGYPCELDALNQIARKNGIRLIEDAAHAFGASYKGKPIGSHSDFVCFSFQAIKHLTTIDGGALVCRSTADFKRGKLLRWFGIDREGERKDFRCEEDVIEHGYKFHMNDVCAAVGAAQLKHIEPVLDAHRENGRFYRKHLGVCAGVSLPSYQENRVSAFWLFTLHAKERDKFMYEMQSRNIVVSQVHARNDKHTMMKAFETLLPGVDAFTNSQVSIPVGWWLSQAEKEHIVSSIIELRG